MIDVAALTSYSTASMEMKVEELVERGLDVIDLYCFCPQDLPAVCSKSGNEPWPEVLLKSLRPSEAAERIASIVRPSLKPKGGRPIRRADICGLATFLPDISLPDRFFPEDRDRRKTPRQVTVDVLILLLELIAELRKRGFSCRTLELVAGHTIVMPDSSLARSPPQLRYVKPRECYRALRKSLAEITVALDRIFPGGSSDWRSSPPLLSIEIEPGASKLIDIKDKGSYAGLASVLKQFPHVGLNLDIGHMLILDVSPQIMFGSRLAGRIAHVHISDNANSHFADLCVGSYHREEIFSRWLRALANHARRNGGRFQGCVSVEMEACGSADEVMKAVRITRRLLREAGGG